MELATNIGTYENFTGRMLHNDANCLVENATFEILEEVKTFKGVCDIQIVFYDGTVNMGGVNNFDIRNGVFCENVYISKSIFRNGIFNGSNIFQSYWLGGRFNGCGYSPLYDKFGRMRYKTPKEWDNKNITSGIANKIGTYNNFSGTIKWNKNDAIVKDAEFELTSGISYKSLNFLGGTIVDGIITDANIQYGIFKNGKIEKSNWSGGIFEGGTWFNGYWYRGIWESGHWLDGIWHGGYDKNGTYHIVNPPNKWVKQEVT